MGPMEFDLDGFVALRLNEHALHLWDVEVTFDPTATVAPTSVPWVVDNLAMFAGFTGRPAADARTVLVATTEPVRRITLTLGPDRVGVAAAEGTGQPDLELPAEALVRLVYGRLDPDHTPTVGGAADLDGLRQVFPGA